MINFDRGIEGTYKFNIASERAIKREIKDFQEVFYKSVTEQFIGSWDVSNGTSGGCSQEPTFYKNPSYIITVKKDT